MQEIASFHPLTKESIRRHQLFVEWVTPEYVHTHKTIDWYWTVGLVAAAGVIVALLVGNILFALLLVVGTFSLLMYAKRPPEHITISVNSRGVRVKDRLYPFDNILSFCLKDYSERYILILDIQKIFVPSLVLELDPDEVDIGVLHEYLAVFIPEVEQEVPLTDLIAERLGF